MRKKRSSNQETLGEAINRLLDVYRLRSGLTEISIRSDWEKIAGAAIASRTDEILLRGSKLIIKLSSPALRQELHYQRDDLRKLVNDYLGTEQVKEVLLQ